MKKLLLFIPAWFVIACETTLYPELDEPANLIVVDAWINQKPEKQVIRISLSQPYFDTARPPAVKGATVFIEDMHTGDVFLFEECPDGYCWDRADAPFGTTGHRYRLEVTANGEVFEAFATLGRVPPVDSVYFRFHAADMLVNEDYFTAEFMATDPPGTGDTYWIKGWKNNTFLNKPAELNMAYDAGFSAGQSVDGEAFLIPIRRDYINPMDRVEGKAHAFHPPYQAGDSVYVEIHSIDPLAFDYLWGLYFQINRPGGFAELFSMPLSNVSTNLKAITGGGQTRVAGFFNVAAVSGNGARLTEEVINRQRHQ